jgi:hypothetical protein
MMLTLTVAMVALGMTGSACGADDPNPDLFLSPSQDVETLRKAWSVKLPIDYRTTSFDDILSDLAKRSGIEIQLDVGKLDRDRHPNRRNFISTGPLYFDKTCHDLRARHLLSAAESKNASEARCCVQNDPEAKRTAFRCTAPVPVAAAIERLAESLELEVSYRKGCIVLSTYEALGPERLLTREFHVKQGRGMIYYHVNGNTGETTKYRLNLLDKVGLFLARCGHDHHRQELKEIGRNPTGAYGRLRKIDPGVEVKFDIKKNVLTITAEPEMLFQFKQYYLEYVDKFIDSPPPESRKRKDL